MSRIWTILDHPHWDPGAYVARQCEVKESGGEPWPIYADPLRAERLEDLRAELERRGHHRFERHPFSDPLILECWV